MHTKRRNEAEAEIEHQAREYIRCSLSFEHFLSYVQTYDAETSQTASFPKYPYILDLAHQLEHLPSTKGTMVVLKSRQMGISWLFTAYFTWGLLFRHNYSALLVSRKEELVDRPGDLRALFTRMRFILDRLPEYLFPYGTRSSIRSTFRLLQNPAHNSSITGEATTSDTSRGGSYTEIYADEFAFLPDQPNFLAAATEAAKARLIAVSTPNGRNTFYTLWQRAESGIPGYVGIKIHWSQHPHRDMQWYDMQKLQYGSPVLVARELDLSFEQSLQAKVFTMFDVAKHVIPPEKVPKTGISVAGIDFGIGDPTAIVFTRVNKGIVYVYDELVQANAPVDTIVHLAQAQGTPLQKQQYIFADPSGMSRTASGETIFGLYAKYDINMLPSQNQHDVTMQKLFSIFSKPGAIYISKKAHKLITALELAQYPVDRQGNIKADIYRHDEHSHILDALRYLVSQVHIVLQHEQQLKHKVNNNSINIDKLLVKQAKEQAKKINPLRR